MATTAVQPIPMWRSRTFWANAVVALLAIIAEVQAILPAFADILVVPNEATRWLLLAVALLNIVLRRLSDQPARFTSADRPVAVESPPGWNR